MRRGDGVVWSLLVLGLCALLASSARAQDARGAGAASHRVGFFQAAGESLTGDVYADPSRWRPLSLGTFFSEGWDEAWVSPPPGGGGAPRQGWINAADGVFYRLAVATFAYKNGSTGNGDV
jgi:hypothetical protein